MTPFEWIIRGIKYPYCTSEFYVCCGGFGPADSSPNNWCRSPKDWRQINKMSRRFWDFTITVQSHIQATGIFQMAEEKRSPSCRKWLQPSILLLVKSYTMRSCLRDCSKGELCFENSTTALTLLCYADARLLNLCDSLTNQLQSSKSQPSNTVWQGSKQSYRGMFCLVYFRARLYHGEPRRVSWPLLGWCH